MKLLRNYMKRDAICFLLMECESIGTIEAFHFLKAFWDEIIINSN
jgi:hypothetical protein